MVSRNYCQRIVRERMEILFRNAEERFDEFPELSDRYVEIARSLGMKYNVPLPRYFSRRVCSECGSFLVPGSNCRVRLVSEHGRKAVTCLNCGNIKRYPYGRDSDEEK